MTAARDVARHYGRADRGAAILAALIADGKDIDHLTPDDLAPVDELHTRGRASTVDLARLLSLTSSDRVLDLGCGIGGPARYLAATFGCHVTGLDLTSEFVAIAEMLAARMSLASIVDFVQSDALAAPFPDAGFDVVWSQNAVMNIEDRERFYAEIRRLLRPGGRYAFSDVVAGTNGPPIFPVGWAREPSISFLRTAEQTRDAIEGAGLTIAVLQNQTAEAIAHAHRRLKVTTAGTMALSPQILFGAEWNTMATNMLRSLEQNRVALYQGIAMRPAD